MVIGCPRFIGAFHKGVISFAPVEQKFFELRSLNGERRKIIRKSVFNGGIKAPCPFTNLQHIPQADMMIEQALHTGGINKFLG